MDNAFPFPCQDHLHAGSNTSNNTTHQFLFLAKMIKSCGILAAARKLDDPKSITTNQELAGQFCECTAEMGCQCHGMDAECLEALLTYDAKDQKHGILSVLFIQSNQSINQSMYWTNAPSNTLRMFSLIH